MGNAETKGNFRKAVIDLTSKQSKLDDTNFWGQFWSPNSVSSCKDLFDMIPANDIRSLRENSPNNLATLCYKAVDCLIEARDTMVPQAEQRKVINCIRLLTRIIPFMFEDEEWRTYFWSALPQTDATAKPIPLASALLTCLGDLLFCPGFTVAKLSTSETTENLSVLDSCEYIWQNGVGFTNKPPINAEHDLNRTEILKLLLTCFSEIIYLPDNAENRMRWLQRFASAENRHVLPLFTSLLNVICSYDPVGYGLPYNYLLVGDSREPLVQVALQLLIVCLDRDTQPIGDESGYVDNFFIHYLSRIHREDDFEFMLRGMTRLLNNPLQSSYLPNSVKKVTFHQELLIFLWKCCEYNQKFMYYVLKTSDVLEILVPILYHINDARNDPSRVGLIHMGVFLILLLSGERNFGVRLNKPYISKGNIDIQAFTGTHADLLIIVAHKLITTGNYRLQSLFDCLLTIIVNVSPYLKSLSMITANKLVHLVEAFSTPWYLFSSPNSHHLVFFLLEVFNNIIQYQFDGNSNLIYTIIRKRQVFYQLANLNTDASSIAKSLNNRRGKQGTAATEAAEKTPQSPTIQTPPPPENSENPLAAVNNAKQASGNVEENEGPNFQSTLAKTPAIASMTDKSAEWSQQKPPEGDGNGGDNWIPTTEWVESWKSKLPLQTIMRLLQVLVPQVEKICIDKNLTDEGEILKFLQNGTLVGLLPVPHPLLLRRYQANAATNHWFRTYMWGLIYLRNTDPPIWYDTEVKLFEIQKT
uniref:Protein HID1 n=1 Tax=Panagrolaimus superbus TaxID=310955 RepID=A0A914Y1R8_9BILA